MERQEVFQRITDLINRDYDVPAEKITEQASLSEDLGLGSVDILELGMSLENDFNINIPDDLVDNVKTVGQVLAAIVDLLPKEPSGS